MEYHPTIGKRKKKKEGMARTRVDLPSILDRSGRYSTSVISVSDSESESSVPRPAMRSAMRSRFRGERRPPPSVVVSDDSASVASRSSFKDKIERERKRKELPPPFIGDEEDEDYELALKRSREEEEPEMIETYLFISPGDGSCLFHSLARGFCVVETMKMEDRTKVMFIPPKELNARSMELQTRIAQFLAGETDSHIETSISRSSMIDLYMSSTKDETEEMKRKKREAYTAAVRKKGYNGTDLEISAFCYIFNVPVIVFTLLSMSPLEFVTNTFDPNNQLPEKRPLGQVIYLQYTGDGVRGHYNLIMTQRQVDAMESHSASGGVYPTSSLSFTDAFLSFYHLVRKSLFE